MGKKHHGEKSWTHAPTSCQQYVQDGSINSKQQGEFFYDLHLIQRVRLSFAFILKHFSSSLTWILTFVKKYVFQGQGQFQKTLFGQTRRAWKQKFSLSYMLHIPLHCHFQSLANAMSGPIAQQRGGFTDAANE